MKNSLLKPAAFLAALSLLGAGCFPAPSPEPAAPSVPSSTTDRMDQAEANALTQVDISENSYHAREQVDEAFACVYDMTVPLINASGHPAIEERLNFNIQLATGERASSTSSPRTLESLSDDFIRTCRENRLEEGTGLLTSGEEQFFDQGFEVQRNSDGILSIELPFDEYSGGAHPYGGSTAVTLDLHTGDSILLEHEIANAQQNAFYRFVRSRQLDQSEDMMFQDIAETFHDQIDGASTISNDDLADFYSDQSYYFGEDGLVIYDDPYVIGPYAAGRIETSVSYAELDEYLKSSSPLKRLTE